MKKIDEAAKISFDRLRIAGAELNWVDFKGPFRIGVEFAQSWISVEDEFPFGYVTLKCSSPFGKVVYVSVDFSGANEVDTKWMATEYYKATHWRPIELK